MNTWVVQKLIYLLSTYNAQDLNNWTILQSGSLPGKVFIKSMIRTSNYTIVRRVQTFIECLPIYINIY